MPALNCRRVTNPLRDSQRQPSGWRAPRKVSEKVPKSDTDAAVACQAPWRLPASRCVGSLWQGPRGTPSLAPLLPFYIPIIISLVCAIRCPYTGVWEGSR